MIQAPASWQSDPRSNLFALSIQQPWAYAILALGKSVENRTWACPAWALGQRIIVHAGKAYDSEAEAFIKSIHPEIDFLSLQFEGAFPLGVLVGEITITSSWQFSQPQIPLYEPVGDETVEICPWAFGPYCWDIEDTAIYDQPIPCTGQLGFFRPFLRSVKR